MARRSFAVLVALSMALGAANAAAQDEPPVTPVGIPSGVPASAPADPPPPGTTKLYSPVMAGVGAGLMVLGALGLGVGAGVYANNDKSVVSDVVRSIHGADTVLMISGGALLLIGIPLLAVGVRQVPAQPAAAAWLRPRLVPAPGGVGVGWVF